MFSMVGAKNISLLGNGNQALGCTLTVGVSGVIMIICFWMLFALTKDYAYHPGASVNTAAAEANEKMSIAEMLKQILVNPPLIGLMMAELGRYLGRFIIFGFAFCYFKYLVYNLSVIAIFFTGLTLVNFCRGIFNGASGQEIRGTKRVYGLALSLLHRPAGCLGHAHELCLIYDYSVRCLPGIWHA